MMKKVNVFFQVLLACLMIPGVCLAAAQGEPRAFVPENSYEFAPLPEGKDIIHGFVIENRGDAELQIQQVKTG
ncbi:MAG TPA: hypothetical protein VJ936_05310 [Desulfobacteraceae bacterium]|nr:hypothetical protein [Desulfobacteraceae bacterium]